MEEKGFQGLVQDEREVTAAPRSFGELLLVTQPEAKGALAIGVELTEGEPHTAYTERSRIVNRIKEKPSDQPRASVFTRFYYTIFYFLSPLYIPITFRHSCHNWPCANNCQTVSLCQSLIHA
jgi:hypothetical protein